MNDVFCYFTRARRDRHSFPTRRSSDLHGECHHQPPPHRPPDIGWARGGKRRLSLRAVAGIAEQLESLNGAFRRAPSQYPDRKSTRLNSSHVETSYAVFCLKKKTNTMRD